MKTIIFFIPTILIIFMFGKINAQNIVQSQTLSNTLFIDKSKYNVPDEDYEVLFLNKNVTTHIISTLTIDYTDISTDLIVGQLAKDNVLALKAKKDLKHGEFLGYITLLGEDYVKQYKAYYTENLEGLYKATTRIFVKNHESYYNPLYPTTTKEFREYATKVLHKKRTYFNVSVEKNKIEIILNNIFIVDGFYFIDYTVKNRTNVRFDIDDVIYKINDKKVYKATNSQILYLEEKYNHYKKDSFKKEFRNVIVLDKFTFPNDKVFQIELKEKVISGRDLTLSVDYSDFLKADVL